MKRKIQKEFTYEGFGFPILLTNVPMIKTRGEWTPDIDFNKLQQRILIALATKPFCLTGNEIRFIRKYFRKTLENFGLEFGVSHVAVIDWEVEKNNPAKMNPATEKCLRLFILDSLVKPDKKFREAYHVVEIKKLAEQQKTKQRMKKRYSPFKFDISELHAA